MEFFDTVKNRTSVSKYKNTKVEKEKLQNIIDAAMRSPSWKNRTSYRIIVVDDRSVKDDLANAIVNKDDKAANAVREADLSIVIISKPEESGEVEGKDFYLVDAAIAMEHIILAATAEGYGTLWIGALDEDKVKSILSIPEEYRVVGITPLGVSDEEEKHNEPKNRESFVFLNEYNKPL